MCDVCTLAFLMSFKTLRYTNTQIFILYYHMSKEIITEIVRDKLSTCLHSCMNIISKIVNKYNIPTSTAGHV